MEAFRAAALALAALTLTACMRSGGAPELPPIPEPPPTPATSSTTSAPDHAGVVLRAVTGRSTTTTIALTPGKATLKGTVVGPGGPVGGATVRAERMVGTAVAGTEIVAQPDGTWALAGVKGGSYRIRAWRPPDLAMVEPAFVFLGAAQELNVELKPQVWSGVGAASSVTPTPPVTGQAAVVAVHVTQREVDAAGVVQAAPVVGARVQLASPNAGWTVTSANPTVTDGAGRARWDVSCKGPGNQPLFVAVGAGEQFPISVPACAPPPAPPPPASVSPSPTTAPVATPPPTATTTTTRAPATTTTTRR